MIKNYKHIIWDWNGTLFDDTSLSVDIINRVLKRRNLSPLSMQEYRDIFTFPVKNYYEKAGLDFSKYSFAELGKEWMDEYENRKLECNLHSGARNVLAYVKSKSGEQSILSAYSQHTLVEIVKHFELDHFFSHLVGLDNIYAVSKVDLGKELMKQLGNGKGEVLLIGDTVHDYEVAMEIGADCLLIANGHQSKKKLLECGVNVLDSIIELINETAVN